MTDSAPERPIDVPTTTAPAELRAVDPPRHPRRARRTCPRWGGTPIQRVARGSDTGTARRGRATCVMHQNHSPRRCRSHWPPCNQRHPGASRTVSPHLPSSRCRHLAPIPVPAGGGAPRTGSSSPGGGAGWRPRSSTSSSSPWSSWRVSTMRSPMPPTSTPDSCSGPTTRWLPGRLPR